MLFAFGERLRQLRHDKNYTMGMVEDRFAQKNVSIGQTALGKYEDTYIYDSSLLGFENSTVIEPSSDLGIKLSQEEAYLESQKAKIATAASDEEFETEYQNMIDTLNSYDITAIDAEFDKVYKEYCEKKGSSIEDVNAALYQ